MPHSPASTIITAVPVRVGVGFDHTPLTIVSGPAFEYNTHFIDTRSKAGNISVKLDNTSARENRRAVSAACRKNNTVRGHNDVFEIMRKEFNKAEIIDLTLVCCCFNMINRVADSLKLPIEIQSEIGKIKTSVRLDPERIKNDLFTVVGK